MSYLNDNIGFKVFMVAHIPLYYYIFSSLYGDNKESFMYGFSIFLIVHLALHLLFLMHKKNEFKDFVSWTIIGGAGACGLIEIVLTTQ